MYVELPGSAKELPFGARIMAPADKAKTATISVYYRKFDTRGGDTLTTLRKFAQDTGLTIDENHPGFVQLTGTVGQLQDAFLVALKHVQHADGTEHRGRDGPIHVPEDLVASGVTAVLGLDDGPIAKPHWRRRQGTARAGILSSSGYTGKELASIYNAPPGTDGTGACIRICALGGRPTDAAMQQFFTSNGMPVPVIQYVSVDGANFTPGGDPSGADVETDLDISASGGAAPKAVIQVYMAPNSDAGFADCWSRMVNDPLPAGCTHCVGTTSWGSPETNWTQQAMKVMDGIAADGKAKGMAMCAASGDNGSDDGVGDGKPHADFPSSGPNVVAVGGTTGAGQGATVWGGPSASGATGGAPSTTWTKPPYQGVAPGSFRCTCDVAAVADPATGYATSAGSVGGTSGASPMWAGMIALVNQALVAAGKSPIGDLHKLVYAGGCTQDITQGTNGQYSAKVGYDLPTGMGAPDGARLLAAALGSVPPTPTGPTGPPPPPPPPPPPTVPPIEQVIALVDHAFAVLEAKQTSWYMRALLAQVNQSIDKILRQLAAGHADPNAEDYRL